MQATLLLCTRYKWFDANVKQLATEPQSKLLHDFLATDGEREYAMVTEPGLATTRTAVIEGSVALSQPLCLQPDWLNTSIRSRLFNELLKHNTIIAFAWTGWRQHTDDHELKRWQSSQDQVVNAFSVLRASNINAAAFPRFPDCASFTQHTLQLTWNKTLSTTI